MCSATSPSPSRANHGCSEDLGHFPGGDRGYHARRHVSPSHQAQEGRQRAPLLEHRGESPGRRRPCGAAAAAVPWRDQRFAGTGLAQVDRRPRGRSGGAAPPVAVPGEDRCEGVLPDAAVVRLKLAELRLCRPRQWGGCWLAVNLWRELALDRFWAERLGPRPAAGMTMLPETETAVRGALIVTTSFMRIV